MSTEIWKEINILNRTYLISSNGRVKSLITNRILNGSDCNGYRVVHISNNGIKRKFYIHRLVAQAFIPCANQTEVNHKDEDKTNNKVENLEWCDRKYNCNYGTRNKRSADKRKIAVIGTHLITGEKIILDYCRMGETIGIDHSSIIRCCKGISAYAGDYKWEYL